MTISASIYAGARVRQTGALDLGTPAVEIDTGRKNFDFVDGVTAGKADRVFSDRRTLAASASENLDLAGGLTDAFGAALTFAKVVALVVRAADANASDIVLGGAASNAFVGPFGAATHTIAVKPGGAMVLVAPKGGWAVTAATGDLLKVLNGSGAASADYDILVLGTSA
ncbi:hypothetical protein [Xanthobacter autotrophicus]|uniref:hypothetical protein n=1 Tax=Xanthobacter autotrophicus TaxID=280 RepID=UPI00372B8F65